jgi:hypothetical protein
MLPSPSLGAPWLSGSLSPTLPWGIPDELGFVVVVVVEWVGGGAECVVVGGGAECVVVVVGADVCVEVVLAGLGLGFGLGLGLGFGLGVVAVAVLGVEGATGTGFVLELDEPQPAIAAAASTATAPVPCHLVSISPHDDAVGCETFPGVILASCTWVSSRRLNSGFWGA